MGYHMYISSEHEITHHIVVICGSETGKIDKITILWIYPETVCDITSTNLGKIMKYEFTWKVSTNDQSAESLMNILVFLANF